MKNVYVILSLLVLNVCFIGLQAQNKFKPLAIGDTLPELPYHQIINYHQDSVKLSDFKGKLLILDFWNTWCTACLASFPKLKKLQEQFEKDIKILLVVSDDVKVKQDYLDYFKMRTEIGLPINFPSIVEDKVLRKIFPHYALPYTILIDTNGVIRSIDNGGSLNEINLKKILKSNRVDLSENNASKNFQINYDPTKPFLLYNNGGSDSSFLQRSIIAKNVGFKKGGNLIISRSGGYTRLSLMNVTMLNLFTAAFWRRFPTEFNGVTGRYTSKEIPYEAGPSLLASEIMLKNSKDVDKYKDKVFDFYSYELILSSYVSDNEILDQMIIDINRMFKVNARLEERSIEILELYVKNSNKLLPTKYQSQRLMINFDKNENRFVFANVSLKTFVHTLNKRMLIKPLLVDNSNIDFKVDLFFRLEFLNGNLGISSLKRELKKYGLGLRKNKSRIKMLVIGG